MLLSDIVSTPICSSSLAHPSLLLFLEERRSRIGSHKFKFIFDSHLILRHHFFHVTSSADNVVPLILSCQAGLWHCVRIICPQQYGRQKCVSNSQLCIGWAQLAYKYVMNCMGTNGIGLPITQDAIRGRLPPGTPHRFKVREISRLSSLDKSRLLKAPWLSLKETLGVRLWSVSRRC